MRVGIIAESLVEWLALRAGRVPEPIVDVFPPLVVARSIMAAVNVGVFRALSAGPTTPGALAAELKVDHRALVALLGVLESDGYVTLDAETYALGPKARRWLRCGDSADVSAYIRFNYLQWEWLSGLERFIESGTPIAFHQTLTEEGWRDYERGMAAIARLTLPEVVLRAPLSARATAMLDIGGGHGLAAERYVQRYPTLSACVLDLPRALAAAPAPASRVKRIEGDALTYDLGSSAWDAIYVANLLHHFDSEQIRGLAARIATALRPGGVWIIQDGIRESRRRSQRMAAAVGDLYFALTSASGFWSFPELAAFQFDAGLRPRRPIRLLTAPGQGLQIAFKPDDVGTRR